MNPDEAAFRAERGLPESEYFTFGDAPVTCPRCGARPAGWMTLGAGVEGYDCACGFSFVVEDD